MSKREASAPPEDAKAGKAARGAPPFEDMVFVLSGEFGVGKDVLAKIISDGGGRVVGSFSGKVTHVATADLAAKTVKVKAGRKKKKPIVDEAWVLDRARAAAAAAGGAAAAAAVPKGFDRSGMAQGGDPWWADRGGDGYAAREARALEHFMAGRPANKFAKYGILPVRFVKWGRCQQRLYYNRWMWDDNEPEALFDFDVTDARGRVWPLTARVWQGDADANTGAFGFVKHRRTGATVVGLDGANHGDCVTKVTVGAPCARFAEHPDGVLPADDEFTRDMYLENEFTDGGASQLARICAVAASLGCSDPMGTYLQEQPEDLRAKFAAARLSRAFDEAGLRSFPRDLVAVVAAYDPAYLPTEVPEA